MHIKVSTLPEGYEIMSYELVDIGRHLEQQSASLQLEHPGYSIHFSKNTYGLEGWTLSINGYKLILNMQLPPPNTISGADLSIALYSTIIRDPETGTENAGLSQAGGRYVDVAEYELCLEISEFKWFDRAGGSAGLKSSEIVSLLVNKLLAKARA